MRILTLPLSIFGLTPIGTATLAGVIISLLGTLAAALAIFELGQARNWVKMGDCGPHFICLFSPAAFFLAVVYTEGLFLGLAFSSLVLTAAWTSGLGGFVGGFCHVYAGGWCGIGHSSAHGLGAEW